MNNSHKNAGLKRFGALLGSGVATLAVLGSAPRDPDPLAAAGGRPAATASPSSAPAHSTPWQEPAPPDRARLLADLRHARPDRPRLVASAADIDALPARIVTSEPRRTLYANTLRRADELLSLPPVEYRDDGTHLRRGSWEISKRAMELGTAYRLTRDARYAERLWVELDTLCGFPNWRQDNLKDYLNCGNLSGAAAIAYDWCRDYLTPERRKRVVDTILARSVDSGLGWYSRNVWWSKSPYNWNGVCNGGIGLAALAIFDENDVTRDRCSRLLEHVFKSLPLMLREMEPDGGGDEGVSYQGYGLMQTVDFIASLPNVFGTDYGLGSYPGLGKAGDFRVYMAGTTSTFNMGDSGSTLGPDPRTLLLSRLSGSPLAAAQVYKLSKLNGTARDLLWYVDVPDPVVPHAQDAYFRGTEVVGMHTNLLGDGDIFLGFRAGTTCAHADNDRGTFYYEALGEVWATDLGAERYSIPGYFNISDDSPRWQLYRKSAQGHNTLVINPRPAADQKASAISTIERFDTSPARGLAIADLTPVYDRAVSVRRGVRLERPGGIATIRDELVLTEPSDVWWFMHIADARFTKLDTRTMRISRNEKSILIRITEGPGEFEVMDAVALPGTATVLGETPNPNVKKLAIRLPRTTNLSLNVVIIPLTPGTADALPPAPSPLSQW